MNATAFDRARQLTSTRGGSVAAAKILGVLQAVLMLLMFLVAGALLALLATRGEGELPRELRGDAPSWLESRISSVDLESAHLSDAGLIPFAIANVGSNDPIHSAISRGMLRVIGAVPTLRNNLGALATLLALSLLLFVVIVEVSRARRRAAVDAATEASASLRRQLHRQMYRLGQSSLPTEGTGPVVGLFSREVNDVRDGLIADLDARWIAPIVVVGLVLIATLISWTSTLFLASLGGLTWLAARSLAGSSGMRSTIASRDLALQYYLLQEDLGLLRTVRVHGMEAVDKERFEEHLERHREADADRLKTDSQGFHRKVILHGVAGTLALGILMHSVVVGGASPAAALAVLGAILGMVPPISRWIAMRSSVRQAGRSATGIFEYLERAPELQQSVGAQFVPPLRRKITFENVTLLNAKGRTILDGFSAEIVAGNRVAVMSLDEESKYAIACLIPRLIDPKSGRVRFDGLDLREVTLESIRAQVASVLQADLVFSDTIFENIALGDASYELPRVIEAAKVAHVHQFISDLPQGYDTLIGPMGHYLTIDQQYRIGLARAFLHDPSIVILEEPNTDLDDDTKHLIDDTTTRLAQGRTLIVLPRRLSTIRSCDQAIVIHNGRLESSGNPRELQPSSKLFRHLQYIEFNQFATGEMEAGQMSE